MGKKIEPGAIRKVPKKSFSRDYQNFNYKALIPQGFRFSIFLLVTAKIYVEVRCFGPGRDSHIKMTGELVIPLRGLKSDCVTS